MSLARYRGRANRYANYGGAFSLAQYAYRNRNAIASRARQFMMNRTRTNTRTRVSSGQGVTSQYDRKLIYRKRYMPRRKKRAWRKFKNKVVAVSTKSLGSNTVVRNDLIQSDFALIPTATTAQNVIQLALYAVRSNINYLNDVNEISNDTRLNPSSKMIFMSGVLDITMRFQTLLSSLSTGNPSLSAEVDLYEMQWNGPSGQSGEATNIQECFANGATDTAVIPGQATTLDFNSRGWTPFDGNSALSQHKIKIIKKTKFFLSSEQTATYQLRDPKTHVYTKDAIPSTASANWQGVTKWIFIVWKVIPGYNYVAAPNNDIARLNVGFTRKYMYKINQDSTDYDMYQT